MENKLFTIVNRDDEDSFLTDLSNNPDNFNKKLVFVFGNSENYIVVNGEKFLHKPESAERTPVDLGLPSGTLWAAGNIGAELPWETGKYFAWGETTGYTDADVTSGVRTFDKESYNTGSAASISADLTLEEDAARTNLGGNWQMPTADYYQELVDNCIYSPQSNYGGSGVTCAVFKSMVNGNELVIPITGYYNGTSKSSSKYVYCWSSSWSGSNYAKIGGGSNIFTATSTSSRYYGLNVRAIVSGARTPGSGIGTEKSYKYIDLGLPSGLLWATCNVGTRSPEQAGLYFAWGETTGYTVEQVKSGERLFNSASYNAGSAASISADLTLEQDAAHVNLGGNWRMPTKDEYQELIDNCDVNWVSSYMGKCITGKLFISKINGNSVFFPSVGSFNGNNSTPSRVNDAGGYWSASWGSSSDAWNLFFDYNNQFLRSDYGYRKGGKSVRGVLSFPSPPAESTSVDLGLPSGLKWAEGNVGATSPEEYGLYFAWGETTGYTDEQVTSGVRAFNSASYKAASISANLTLEQDAAHVNLGGNWRMPTKDEYQELIDNCNVAWTNDYNGTEVRGCIFTSKYNGNSIFFPAAGYGDDSDILFGDVNYWSASWDSPSYAWGLQFFIGMGFNQGTYKRYWGFSVRGVCK